MRSRGNAAAKGDLPQRLSGSTVYHEEQRFRQWWLWVLVAGLTALGWWSFAQQILLGRPFGGNPAPDWGVWLLWLVIGVGLPLFFARLELVLEVTSRELLIRYRPLSKRVLRLDEIERLEVRSYSPIGEYGGWGIKGWSRKKVAYNVSGHRGVDLTLRDGRRVMLGSQRAEELAETIERQRSQGRREE